MKLKIDKEQITQLNHSKIFCVIYTLLLISFSTHFFSNNSWQNIEWTFPYFSGAANFENLFDWKISPYDYSEILERSIKEGNTDFYYYYKHQKTDELVENIYNSYGYVLVAKFSKKILPFLGDLQGVVWVQIAVHLIISIFLILVTFKRLILRYGLILFYASNPLIIYFATFPFYYFWMVLPSFFLVVILIRPDWKNWWLYISTPFLILSLMIRPTTIFLCCWTFVATFKEISSTKFRIVNLPILGVFIGSSIFISQLSSGSPWHTMYIGLGAYPNNIGIDNLDDEQGYKYFESQTGIKIDTNAVTGNWNNVEIQKKYQVTLKERYFEIVCEEPILVFKNALMNLLQVFSIGYIVNQPILTYVNTFIGLVVLIFLVYNKQVNLIVPILANSISFTWYFPPIPAYNFATYLLLTIGVLIGVELMIKKTKKRRL